MKLITKQIHYKLFTITSDAFTNETQVPIKYTCDGANVNPPLHISSIPEATKCLAIIVDAPNAKPSAFTHWLMWNIPVTHFIKENEAKGEQGTNDFCKQKYCGPCPPASELHRYCFKVYALDTTLNLYITSEKKQLETAMSGHILAFGELCGLYTRYSI
jgi:Raf kinase inhibitor-like YbhB/YbcL family protein